VARERGQEEQGRRGGATNPRPHLPHLGWRLVTSARPPRGPVWPVVPSVPAPALRLSVLSRKAGGPWDSRALLLPWRRKARTKVAGAGPSLDLSLRRRDC